VIGGVVATVRCCCWYADVCYSNEGLDLLVPTLLELCAVAPRVTIWFAQVRRSVLAVARRKSRDVELSSHGGGRCVRRARIISFPCMWESVAATTRALERLRIEIGVRGRFAGQGVRAGRRAHRRQILRTHASRSRLLRAMSSVRAAAEPRVVGSKRRLLSRVTLSAEET